MCNADTNAHTERMCQLMKANDALRSERRQKHVVAAVAGQQKKPSASRIPPAIKPAGRQGAKQVKRLKQLSSTSCALSPEEAEM